MSDLTQSPVVKEALGRLKRAIAATSKQADREKDDLRCQLAENLWTSEMRDGRASTVVGGMTVPPRPIISIPKLDQPIQMVLNQEKAAHLGVNVHPLSEDADDDTAEVIQGIYHKIEQDSNAQLARSWAFDRAVKAGRGCYRVHTKYCDWSENPSDQEIVISRILDQSVVYFDPSAQESDWSDGEWAFVLSWVPWDRYKRLYGEKDGKPWSSVAGMDTADLKALMETEPDWVNFDDGAEKPAILVAEYWRKVYTTRYKVSLDDGSFDYEDAIPKGRVIKGKFRRPMTEPKVEWSTINAVEELESEEWNGRYIPLIPVIGKELQPYDSDRRFTGIIGPAKEAARMFNYAASNAIELSSLEPRAQFDIDPREIEGFEHIWSEMNYRNFPYLPRHKWIDGKDMGPLQRIQVDVGKLGPSLTLLAQADSFIQAATANIDQGRIDELSRKKVAHQTLSALQQQSDASNSHWIYNLANISMVYEAKVVLDLMGKIYDRPGRIARMLDYEDNQKTVMLGQPFILDPQTKRPVAAQGNPEAKTYDLTKGVYGVDVSIGKSYQTRLEQGGDEIGQILQADPALMPLIGATYFKFRDFPGSREIAELMKKVRAKQFPGIDDDKNDPQAAQAENEALKGQLQQMQEQLKQAAQMIETEQVKQAAQVSIAKESNATKIRIEEMGNEVKVAIAKMDMQIEIAKARFEARVAQETAGAERAHDARTSAADRSANWDMAERAAEQAAETLEQQGVQGMVSADQSHEQELETADVGQQHALEQQEQAAALAPEPAGATE